MHRRPLGFLFALLFTVSACESPLTEPAAGGTDDATAVTGVAEAGLDATVPSGWQREAVAFPLPEGAMLADGHLGEAARRLINGDNFQCTPTTAAVDFYFDHFFEFLFGETDLFFLLFVDLWADLIPQWEALFLLTDESPQEFGYSGQFTNVMNRTDRDIRRFWDIFSDDIQLVAMKGTMLQDAERTAAAYQLPNIPPFFGLSEADAFFVAALIQDALDTSQLLDGGNHPLFSFNAFAFSDGPGGLPDKIVMGDAVLEAYEAQGFGDVAAQAIFAHEFAHQVQFENGYFDVLPPGLDLVNPTQAEFTRFTEMMADAMAAYFLTHKRGAAMNWWRVEQFLSAFFQVGDCAFTNPGHHGTPEQRLRASRWGYDLARSAQKNGHILGADAVFDAFVADYLGLIAPDVGQPPPDGNVDPGNSDGAGKGPQF